MTIQIFQVDAFSAEPFKGNPAGVCILDFPQSDEFMQNIAAEMNLSETAFITRDFMDVEIRYFTPTTEVPLCGHATLASAHILYEIRYFTKYDQILFKSKSGDLIAEKKDDWIGLDFPADPPQDTAIPPDIEAGLGCSPVNFKKIKYCGYLAELDTEERVKKLRPNLDLLQKNGIGEITVTAKSGQKGVDFVSRFFGPAVGIDEDPVTGSAHCALTPYWSKKLNKNEMIGHQLSKRGGIVRVQNKGERVKIMGQAVTILKGELIHNN